jgi:tRNA nucleotidyltransferase (CCA-adding enzyme)
MNVFLVGGAVRDELLGRPVTERDFVVTGATPQQMLDLGYRPVGKDFPVYLHPQTGEQYALARTERKTGPGYYGFETRFSPEVTLEEDLARRDLTINAMARSDDGEIIDPHGGRLDLAERRLRHVSPAFVEDPLRVLRVARFAARYAPLGFTLAPETLELMRSMVHSGEMGSLVPERVWQETVRALGEARPAEYFEVLRRCGALAAVFPEIDALWGVPQPARWHPEVDTGVHTMMVLDVAAELSPEPLVRFAALVHDLGKAKTPRDAWPRHIGHERAGVALVHAMCDRLRIPNKFRELGVITSRFHQVVHRAHEMRPATLLELFEHTDAFRRPERFERFLLACESDARGRGPELRQLPYTKGDHLRRALQAAAAVRVDPQSVAGTNGQAIGEKLRSERVAAIREVCLAARARAGDSSREC